MKMESIAMKNDSLTAGQYKIQQGAALVTSLVILVILTMLGMAAINMSTMDEKMAFNSQDRYQARYLSESAVLFASENPAFPFPGTQVGDVSARYTITDVDVPGIRDAYAYKAFVGRTASRNVPKPPGVVSRISQGTGGDDPFIYEVYVGVETEAGTPAVVRTDFARFLPPRD